MNTKQAYIELYREYHKDESKYPGNSFHPHASKIAALIETYDAKTVLDYGCGKGRQYSQEKLHNLWGFMPALYDPAVMAFNKLPTETFDGIYSTDVMEHIPLSVIPEVFDWIFNHANRFVYFNISTKPAIAVLPNGENAHCTVLTIDQWEDLVLQYNTAQVPTYLNCSGLSRGYRKYFV
jgi:hypothetical protein